MKTAVAADEPQPREQYTITATTSNAHTGVTLTISGPGVRQAHYNVDSVTTEGPALVFVDELLTPTEHAALNLTGQLANLISDIIGHGMSPEARGDQLELTIHIHAIQNAILAQAAARAYPGHFRLLGQLGPGLLAKDVM